MKVKLTNTIKIKVGDREILIEGKGNDKGRKNISDA